MNATTKPKKPAPCPICGRPSEPALDPFCSARCADIDLGRWLGERYVIPGGDEAGTDEHQRNEDEA